MDGIACGLRYQRLLMHDEGMATNERKPRPHYYVESRRPGALWEKRWATVRPEAALDAIRDWANECPSLEWRVATYRDLYDTKDILAYRPAVSR